MILFTNARIFDGSGAAAFVGEVLVKDNRISAVNRSATPLSRDGAQVVDALGATLMPGMTEAHAQLSWPTSVERFVPGMTLLPEDLLLVDGDPIENIALLQDKGNLRAIMKDGKFHKAPVGAA
jgi:imidazolonepropionase-like amidohydrolase